MNTHTHTHTHTPVLAILISLFIFILLHSLCMLLLIFITIYAIYNFYNIKQLQLGRCFFCLKMRTKWKKKSITPLVTILFDISLKPERHTSKIFLYFLMKSLQAYFHCILFTNASLSPDKWSVANL